MVNITLPPETSRATVPMEEQSVIVSSIWRKMEERTLMCVSRECARQVNVLCYHWQKIMSLCLNAAPKRPATLCLHERAALPCKWKRNRQRCLSNEQCHRFDAEHCALVCVSRVWRVRVLINLSSYRSDFVWLTSECLYTKQGTCKSHVDDLLKRTYRRRFQTSVRLSERILV